MSSWMLLRRIQSHTYCHSEEAEREPVMSLIHAALDRASATNLFLRACLCADTTRSGARVAMESSSLWSVQKCVLAPLFEAELISYIIPLV
jgi:hypothetical protein